MTSTVYNYDQTNCLGSYPQEASALLERSIKPCYCQIKETISSPSQVIGDHWWWGYHGLVAAVSALLTAMDIISFQIKHLSPVLFLPFSKGTFLLLRLVGMNSHCLFKKNPVFYPKFLPCQLLQTTQFCILPALYWSSSCSCHQSLLVPGFQSLAKSLWGLPLLTVLSQTLSLASALCSPQLLSFFTSSSSSQSLQVR